jgi:hypothetical protein
MLETVRVYAEERLLASGEAIEVRCAHRDWFLAWLESFPIGHLLEFGAGDELVPEADNLTASLEWSLEQGRLDLLIQMASRMLGYWWSYVRVGELSSWWRVLEGCVTDLPEDLRAAALLVGAQHALAAGDFQQMDKLSADALNVAPGGSWTAAYAWVIQGLYWPYVDAERAKRSIQEGRKAALVSGAPELERTAAMWSANLLTGDPDHDAALGALMDELLETIENSPPASAYIVLGSLAALGEIETASRLAAPLIARNPLQRYQQELLAAVVAMGEGRTAPAAEHLRAVAAIVRDYAIPLGEASCLTGYAALAVKLGEHERASRLLASVKGSAPFPFRSPPDALLYRQTARGLRDALDPDTAARCRAEGRAIGVSQALDAELARQPVQPTAR